MSAGNGAGRRRVLVVGLDAATFDLGLPWARSGALPPIGSNMLTPPGSGLILPPAATPIPPCKMPPRSVMMSPNMFVVTITS